MQTILNASDILLAVIDATPDAIFVKDLDGRYVLVNQAAARFLGLTPAQVIGRRDLELYPEETARQFIADNQTVVTEGRAMSFEGVASSDSGTQAYLVTKGVYRDLADAARVFLPGLPVIFMSGFTAVPEAQKRINDSGAPLLTKPSTLSQLERALDAVMPGSRQDTSTS